VCAIPAVAAALGAGDDAAAIAAAGGAVAFRDAVATGRAACVPLDDPHHVWVVVNKLRPYAPVDFEPASLTLPADVQSIEGGQVRTDAAAALTAMAGAAVAEGAGDIGLESGYRSYSTQRKNYGNGGPDVDASVARPGYSEHQSGLAADVVACGSGCGSMDAFAAAPQGGWVAANSWRFGWIVRYEQDRTSVTGYVPEPWHLRYIGTELAAAYHQGGWHTLEEFFGLAPAPDYAD
jgi:D-alanyl-D-alanine carboxypeptidase